MSSLHRFANNCLLPNVKQDIIPHLMRLANSFDGYFSAGELNAAQQWITNPFLIVLTTMFDEDDNLKEDLIEMRSCQRFQLLFEISKLDDFWLCLIGSFHKPI